MKNQQTDETTKRDDGKVIMNETDSTRDIPTNAPSAEKDVKDQTRDQGRERREHVAGDPKGSDR